jgi:hypothetical protein
MTIRKVTLYFILLLLSLPSSYADETFSGQVNILAWFGYISDDDQYIKAIEKECNTKIFYDQYYSGDEFLDRFQQNREDYNIIIFPETIFKLISADISNKNSDLYQNARHYNPIIYNHYTHQKFPHNVVFFNHALMGFLYNKSVINLTEGDTIYSMLHKAGNNTVVMIDDAVETEFLLSLGIRQATESKAKFGGNNSLTPLKLNNFKKLYQGSSVIITNSFQKISTTPSFAFAFQWSGDAFNFLQHAPNLTFFVHPKLSYVSSDLLANLDNKRPTVCVANALASRVFLAHMQDKIYYFSPYGDKPSKKDAMFTSFYNTWMHDLPTLPWIDSVTKARFAQLQREWNLIKLQLDEDNSKKSSHE